MFYCENLTKHYISNTVFSNFTFIFPESGFVLLYGESGCGKTTLLNILAGLIPFNNGSVTFQGEKYINQVDKSEVGQYIGYITQGVHFVDYLTVMDNLRLCSNNDDDIIKHLLDFGLLELKNCFPSTLSGGERQRLAILQALLAEKDIILLDEPTSALDLENKKIVFETLDKIKTKKLIICSSHDKEAKDYADKLIDFNELNKTTITDTVHSKKIYKKQEMKKRKLSTFFNKWYSYDGREKKSRIQFLLVIILAVLAVCISDTPANKLNSNIEYTYKLNQFRVTVSKESEPLLQDIIKKEVIEAPLIYNYSVPVKVKEDSVEIISDYDLFAETLPFKKDAFRLSSRIKYGTYFTGENQIILSWEKAAEIGNPERLVGKTLKLNLYDKDYNLDIVGIFDQFTQNERQYLKASGITNGEYGNYFLNGEFTKRYIKDEDFYMYGKRSYVLYYDSFSSMKKAYDHYNETLPGIQFIYAQIDTDILFLFEALFYILMPIIIIIIPVSVLFYYQTQKIETAYNKHIFSVYQYLGYSFKEIKRCLIIGNLNETMKIIFKAIIVAFPIMIITNYLNSYFVFIPFKIFTYNVYLILALILLVAILSAIMSFKTIKLVKNTGWYSVLLEHRDLI